MIVDRGNGSPESGPYTDEIPLDEHGSEGPEVDEGQQVAAEDILAAFQANDAMGLAKALKLFMSM